MINLRSEELVSLFNFLDEFNVGAEDRKRLEDLISNCRTVIKYI